MPGDMARTMRASPRDIGPLEGGGSAPQAAPPATYEEMVREISTRYEGLSKRLKQIAQFALDNPNDFAIQTIAGIAGRAHVQPSSLIRFAKAFGFEGFSDVQRLFQQRLLETRPSYTDRLQALRRELGAAAERHPLSVLSQFAEANVAALEHLCQEIENEKLVQAVEILDRAEIIHVVAYRRAFPVAASFYYALSQFGRRAHLIDNAGGLGPEQRGLIGPRDAVFVTSFANYTPAVVETAAEAFAAGVPVVAVTDRPLSPLTAHSTVCFFVEDASVHAFRSLGASLCLVQALAVTLGARRG